ncbi:MAG: hypothetical protein Kow0092_19310 [Deferrisomatales bacterium]
MHIAVAGKGGTGKTTVAGMIVRYLVSRGEGRVLAVDADANMNLNEVLGVQVHQTIGQIREGLGDVPPGMTRTPTSTTRPRSASSKPTAST